MPYTINLKIFAYCIYFQFYAYLSFFSVINYSWNILYTNNQENIQLEQVNQANNLCVCVLGGGGGVTMALSWSTDASCA